jgi:hypothetical protein
MTSAVLSMLHESPTHHSAARTFRGRPVMEWTLRRLRRCRRVDRVVGICWADQADAVGAIGVEAIVIGPRREIATIQATAAARAWADGWRGGLHSSCEFDLGFHPESLLRVGGGAILVDPAAAFVDPEIVEQVVDRGRDGGNELAFAPAAVGFATVYLASVAIERLAAAKAAPGVLFAYQPDAPLRDPLASPGCVAPPLVVARSGRRFKLDSAFQTDRFTRLLESKTDDQLLALPAEELVRIEASSPVDPWPRDVTVELTTRRQSRPVFSLLRNGDLRREDLSLSLAEALFKELAARDDLRVTLAGVGDPLLHPRFAEIVTAARSAGIRAIHVETDLLADPEAVEGLADLPIDVVSVHLPALTEHTYERLMGTPGLTQAMANLQRFIARRRHRGTPMVAPTFVKTRDNLAEMEAWYDAWIRAVGSAVIAYPSDFSGLLDDVSVGDMSPPLRIPCRRIASRMTVLSDGSVVSCEEDLAGRRLMGRIGQSAIRDVWQERFAELRSAHADRRWTSCGVCAQCKEWNRP